LVITKNSFRIEFDFIEYYKVKLIFSKSFQVVIFILALNKLILIFFKRGILWIVKLLGVPVFALGVKSYDAN